MSNEDLAKTIIAALREADSGQGGPYINDDDLSDVNIDGLIDMLKVAQTLKTKLGI
ncbi:hypothetical protein Q1W73_16675 [Asticcacaulis sp. ZE23SCel15]|uniref:hypothetical protein n=1 Tax=Asticcacaulis sp. ZE23SCel15 TaxID=3059027 RepID=UPI00265FAF05|nr:hypothetical protein [Asticcacaulis sp. ZE23SCel15]WKL57279.1 hypothetical protein Q1W73_16675 [Asticcacaulis sp. ZE23SCel15]